MDQRERAGSALQGHAPNGEALGARRQLPHLSELAAYSVSASVSSCGSDWSATDGAFGFAGRSSTASPESILTEHASRAIVSEQGECPRKGIHNERNRYSRHGRDGWRHPETR